MVNTYRRKCEDLARATWGVNVGSCALGAQGLKLFTRLTIFATVSRVHNIVKISVLLVERIP